MRVVTAIVLCAATAHADAPAQQPVKSSLVLAPRLDPYVKFRTDPPTPSAHAFGLGLHYLIDFPPRVPVWYGGGLDVRVLSEGWTDFGALAVGGVAKVTGGHAPPVTLELDAGLLFSPDDGTGGYVGGMAMLSFFYLEVGYAYQRELGFDQPAWFGRHQLVLRGIVPVLTR